MESTQSCQVSHEIIVKAPPVAGDYDLELVVRMWRGMDSMPSKEHPDPEMSFLGGDW